jgi:hypothetical protein
MSKGHSPSTSSRLATLGVVVAVVLGGLAREAACRHGLPYVLYRDEYGVLGCALHMVREQTLDPGFYGYGALLTTATVAVVAPTLAWLRALPPGDPRALPSLADLAIGGMDGLGPETSHPELYYVARLLVGSMGVLTIGASAALARRLGGPWAAVVAAFVVAGAEAHVLQSGLSIPNVPLGLFSVLCALSTLAWYEGRRRGLWWAAAFAGAAFACKITGILAIVVPLAAVALSWRGGDGPRATVRDVILVLALPVAIFVLVNPYVLLDPVRYVDALAVEFDAYYDPRITAGYGRTPGLEQLRSQLDRFRASIGWLQLGLVAVGLACAVRRSRGWIVWLMPVVLVLFFATTRDATHRNLISAYPFLAVAAGLAADEGTRWIPARWSSLRAPLLATVAFLVIGRTIAVDLRLMRELAEPDPRSAMADALAPFSGLRVALPDELRVHARDRAKLPHAVGGPLRDLVCSSDADVVVVPPAFWSYFSRTSTEVANAWLGVHDAWDPEGGHYTEAIDPRLHPVFTAGPTSWVPPLHLASLPFSDCTGSVSLDALANPTEYPRDGNILSMVWDGPVAFQNPPPAPGRYEVAWEVRGDSTDDVGARIRVMTPDGGLEALLAPTWQQIRHAFVVTEDTDMRRVFLEFVNDREGGADRSVELGRVWLRPAGLEGGR